MELIQGNGWEQAFQDAVRQAHESGVVEYRDITSTEDYLNFINALVRWIPTDGAEANEIAGLISRFYFLFNQPSLLALQSPIGPDRVPEPLTPLSQWMVRFAGAMGSFIDTPESLTAESLKTFRSSPAYHMDEYIEPRGGWRTFNEFFARSHKPGRRPIAAPEDPSIIVSPADSTFDNQWEVSPPPDSTLGTPVGAG